MLDILRRRDGETEEAYLWRVGQAKDAGIVDVGWYEIANAVNAQFRDEGEYFGESVYRKSYSSAKRFYDSGVFGAAAQDECVRQLTEQAQQLRKERQKLSDERTDYQRSIREQAREESFIELVHRAMSEHIEPMPFVRRSPVDNDSDSMVVCLSDLHAGIEFRNAWNAYNKSIMQNRLAEYANNIADIQMTHRCSVCDVVIGGDNISGLIHPNLRLENNENVIGQLKLAVTYIGEFINTIRKWFDEVNIHCVSGNHSRVSPNKDDHAKGENLDELVPFCFHIMFDDSGNVNVREDGVIDESINSFTSPGGKMFYIVHGDKDTPATVAEKLTMLTGKKPDAIIMSHRHHNAYDTLYGVKVLQTGSVVGIDNHCVDLRIGGDPEQLVVITSKEKAVKCIYDVNLKGGELDDKR